MGSSCCKSEPVTRWFDEFEERELPSTLAGKRIAITGTTSGTGYIAARTCAKKGAEVFLLNRTSSRADESLKKLQEEVPGCKVTQIPCDLQSFASVRGAGLLLLEKCSEGGLDVLNCNAGIMAHGNKATGDGFDVQMQTNQFSHFLLVKLLFPLLKEAAAKRGDARVVMHSSSARLGKLFDPKFMGKNGPELGNDGNTAAFERYHHSKLACILFCHALQGKIDSAGISNLRAFCVTPGAAWTGLIDNSQSSLGSVPLCIRARAFQTGEDGTMPSLSACFLEKIGNEPIKGADFLAPSGGMMNEMTGPVRIIRQPVPDQEKVCVDPASMTQLWEGCEAAILEAFTVA